MTKSLGRREEGAEGNARFAVSAHACLARVTTGSLAVVRQQCAAKTVGHSPNMTRALVLSPQDRRPFRTLAKVALPNKQLRASRVLVSTCALPRARTQPRLNQAIMSHHKSIYPNVAMGRTLFHLPQLSLQLEVLLNQVLVMARYASMVMGTEVKAVTQEKGADVTVLEAMHVSMVGYL